MNRKGFIRSAHLNRDAIPSLDEYPFYIPAIRELGELPLDPRVTFFVGSNGTGKSTLLEAIAIAAGFNGEGGTKNFRFSNRCSVSELHKYLCLTREVRREQTGFFLRAESYFNLGTEIEILDKEPAPAPKIIESYGNRSLHEQSHGESFMALVNHRFGGDGLYILDEPEAALSPSWQLALLRSINDLVDKGGQFIIATHSPLLLAYPRARIYSFDEGSPSPIEYQKTEHYRLVLDFLKDPALYLKHLFER